MRNAITNIGTTIETFNNALLMALDGNFSWNVTCNGVRHPYLHATVANADDLSDINVSKFTRLLSNHTLAFEGEDCVLTLTMADKQSFTLEFKGGDFGRKSFDLTKILGEKVSLLTSVSNCPMAKDSTRRTRAEVSKVIFGERNILEVAMIVEFLQNATDIELRQIALYFNPVHNNDGELIAFKQSPAALALTAKASSEDSLKTLTVKQLKDMAKAKGLVTSKLRKAELVTLLVA